jgi:hypothetical protein
MRRGISSEVFRQLVGVTRNIQTPPKFRNFTQLSQANVKKSANDTGNGDHCRVAALE